MSLETKRRSFSFRLRGIGTAVALLLLRGPATGPLFAQIIGSSKPLTTPAEDESDKVTNLLSDLAERLTTQRLNLRKISCDEQVTLEQFPVKGKPGAPITQRFQLTGERKATDDFSAESAFVETHTAFDSAAGAPGSSAGGSGIEDALLVKDSLSAAAEFLGMNHREIYAQRFVRKDKMNNRPAYVISFQTLKSLEERRITIAGKAVPMRISGTAWIDASSGNVLRIQAQQTKLPKGVHEFSYDIEYPLASPTAFTLPESVRFSRTINQETIITSQQISNCRVN